jgi:hypothetical protein
MILCNKIREVPPFLAESQQTIGCPDCEEVQCGTCSHLSCTDGDVCCHFDGSVLLGNVAMDSNNNQSPKPSASAAQGEQNGRLPSAECEETIKRRIVEQTGGRIRLLRVEIIGNRVVIGGSAPSYYIKQLALRGVRDVLGSAANRIELNVEVSGNP